MPRFDVVQQADDRTRSVFIEAYKTAGAPAQHKPTPHYAAWRDAVAHPPIKTHPTMGFQL